jgi:adenosylmethionine-8-amino-7-oxononanoate aminotransferase
MGAVILGPDLTGAMTWASEEAEEFPHGFTAAGNPLGSAVALKALEILETEGLLENVNQLSQKFMAGLQELGTHKYAGEARGVGFMGAVELVADKSTKAPLDGKLQIPERIANKALEKGLICRPLGQAIVLGPPFIMTEDEMDQMFAILKETMREVFDEVGL